MAENRFGIVTTAKVRETFLRYASNKAALNTYMNGFLKGGSGGTGGTDPAAKPQVSAPVRALVAPQALGSTVAIEVSWAPAVSAGSIERYELQRRKGTAAWTSVSLPSPTATSVNVAVEPGANYRFRLRAVDSGDNVGDWATTVAAKVSLAQENAASVSYTGAWTRVSLSGASGGSVSHAAAAGRIARLAFSGTSVAYVSTRAPGRGIAEVWLDGQNVETIDLYAASVQKARVTWAATVATGTHTLEFRVTGTKRPAASGTRVDVDAFLVHP